IVFDERRRKDHGRRFVDDFHHLETIYFGHLDIEENNIGLVLHDGLCTFEPIAAFGNDLYLRIPFEVFGNHASCQGLIIYQYRLDHTCGILNMLVMICVVALVTNRSVRPNSKNRRRSMPRSPNPVLRRGLLLSLSYGFSICISGSLSTQVHDTLMVTFSVVSYSPYLLAVSTTG